MQRGVRLAAVVGWPAFIAACALELVVFAFVDPAALHGPGGTALGLSPTAVYSLSFFLFWLVAAAAIVVALRLASSPEEINSPQP
jgi:hypothetical protein